MKTNYADILNAFQNGMRQYRAFADGEEMLKLLAGLEQNEQELKNRVSTLSREVDGLEKGIIAAMDNKKAILDEASAGAAKMVAAAKKEAEDIVTEARVMAKDGMDKISTDVEILQDAKDKLTAELTLLRADRDRMGSDLAGLQEKITAARYAVANMLKGV